MVYKTLKRLRKKKKMNSGSRQLALKRHNAGLEGERGTQYVIFFNKTDHSERSTYIRGWERKQEKLGRHSLAVMRLSRVLLT